MIWFIILLVILATLAFIFGFFGRESPILGFSRIFFYIFISILVILLIISVVAWYTDTIKPEMKKGVDHSPYSNYPTYNIT